MADSFASATAYTGMLLMTRKKLENWIWWILTNLASIPLYFYKGAVLTSFQYLVFLVLAVMGLISWKRKLNHAA
jgi:nicotinamide mononucleotide transporter